MQKKYSIIFCSVFMTFFIVGFGFSDEIKLKTDNVLIDLEEDIESAEIGVDASSGTNKDGTAETDEAAKEAGNAEKTEATPAEIDDSVLIRINEDKIYYMQQRCNDIAQLDTMIAAYGNEKDKYVLFDDYADYRTYREVENYLKEKGIKPNKKAEPAYLR